MAYNVFSLIIFLKEGYIRFFGIIVLTHVNGRKRAKETARFREEKIAGETRWGAREIIDGVIHFTVWETRDDGGGEY